MGEGGDGLRELRAAVIAHPDDDEPRRRLAARLVEKGDPRGELILVQLRLAGGHPNPARRRQLRAREEELLRQEVEGRRVVGCVRRHRGGFVEGVKADPTGLRFVGPELAQEPVRRLDLTDVEDGAVVALVRSPVWGRLESLKLRGALRGAGLEALADSAGLASIASLNLAHCEYDVEDLAPLLASPHLRARRLTLTSAPLGDAGAALLAAPEATAWRQGCRELFVARCELGPEGAGALLRPGAFPHLDRLGLGGNELGEGCLSDVTAALKRGSVARIELGACALDWRVLRKLKEEWGARIVAD